MEGHRFKRQDRLARLVHWLNLILESLRGNDGAELTVCPDDHAHATWYSHSTDAGDECSSLSSGRADADLRGFTGANAGIANVDIVIARSEIPTGVKTQRDVVVAGRAEQERIE